MELEQLTNEIKSELVLKAPRSKVWWALTTREGWSGWFSDDVDGEFRVGQQLRLDFGPDGICYAVVAEVDPENCMAYRWHPGDDCAIDKYPESEMTTVSFRLTDHPEGTLLTMTESGFANLPESRRTKVLHLNTDGWKWELAELAAWVERNESQILSSNEIARERIFKAPPEAVYDALATGAGLESWFCTQVEGDFVEGGLVSVTFSTGAVGPLKIVTLDRPRKFVFRWHPGNLDGCRWEDFPEEQATTVSVECVAVPEGTHIKLIESGFENVRREHRNDAKVLHNEGWTKCMDLIANSVEGAAR